MSFMAVAYVPAFLEDRATFVKERANGLYGATAFTIANFFIGIPYLCRSTPHPPFFPSPTPSIPIPTDRPSPDLPRLLHHRLLPLQLSPRRHRLLHLGDVAFSRPPRRRIPGRAHFLPVSQLRRRPRPHSICERSLDECRRFPRQPHHLKSLLALRFPFHRLRMSLFLLLVFLPLLTPSRKNPSLLPSPFP